MKNIIAILSLIVLFTYSSCGCPPDEQIGELSLAEKTKEFLPYTGSETLSFTAPSGSSISFEAPRGMEINNDRLCTRTTCVEAKFGSPSSCAYYAAESRRISYFAADQSAVLDLLLFSDVYTYNTEDFYDAFNISFSAGTPSVTASHIVDVRFSSPFDTTLTAITTFLEKKESIALNGQTFTDVLSIQESGLGVYLQENIGLIAIEMEGEVWLKD